MDLELHSLHEVAVFALAHELRHIAQCETTRQCDEADADCYALEQLEKYRRGALLETWHDSPAHQDAQSATRVS